MEWEVLRLVDREGGDGTVTALSLMASGLGGGVGEGESVPGTAGPPLGEELVLDAQLGVQDGPGHEVSLLHIVHVLQDPAGSIAGH